MERGPYNAGVRTNKPRAPSEGEPAAAAPPRPGRILVETEALFLIGLVAFVAIAAAAERIAGLDEPLSLGPFGSIALAGAPAFLWLGYFYRQDRHEPEPKHYVFGIFLLGALVAAPVAGFLVDQALSQSPLAPLRLDPLGADRIVRALLVVAVAQELCKYAVVRYTVYPNREFDEPLDGIVYATAAGIGFATYENVRFLGGSHGEVLLAAGAATTVVTTLAHACFAGVIGYALGRAKFVSRSHLRRTITLVLGLVCAVALNGAFQLLGNAARARGFAREPWREVAFAAGFVIVVFFVISILSRRLLSPPSAEPIGALDE